MGRKCLLLTGMGSENFLFEIVHFMHSEWYFSKVYDYCMQVIWLYYLYATSAAWKVWLRSVQQSLVQTCQHF